MIEQASQRSVELFKSGYFCAESVLLAMAEHLDVHSDLIPRIATGFCSGISRTGGMCGVVSGAIMGLDLVAGRSSPSDSVETSYTLARKMIDLFEAQVWFGRLPPIDRLRPGGRGRSALLHGK